jgi:hypothetical protein
MPTNGQFDYPGTSWTADIDKRARLGAKTGKWESGGGEDKWGFRAKLMQDPKERDILFRYTKAEVGNQGAQAKQAFMESVTNRADAEGKTVSQLIGGKEGRGSKYYPQITHSRANTALSEKEREEYAGIGGQVEAGSNICNYCTGNASGKVGFAGGPQTAGFGGEKFGVEGWNGKWARDKGFTGQIQETQGTSDQEWEHRAGMQAEREGQGGDPLKDKADEKVKADITPTSVSGYAGVETPSMSLPKTTIDATLASAPSIRGKGQTRTASKGRYFSEM